MAKGRPARDIKGQRFGLLVVVDKIEMPRRSKWACRCDCGNCTLILGYNLLSGHTKSCGCLSRASTIVRNVKRKGPPKPKKIRPLKRVGPFPYSERKFKGLCVMCGEPRRGKMYCSLKCAAGQKFHHPAKMTILICQECGREYEIKVSSSKGRQFCSRACKYVAVGKRLYGSNNPCWKGGRRGRDGLCKTVIARAKRANPRCECCGNTDNLHGHHREAYATNPEQRAERENIEILCDECHAKKHPEIAEWIRSRENVWGQIYRARIVVQLITKRHAERAFFVLENVNMNGRRGVRHGTKEKKLDCWQHKKARKFDPRRSQAWQVCTPRGEKRGAFA